MLYNGVERKISTMPRYTGLKDFVRGCQKLLKMYGNVPVFLEAGDGKVAPFGNALTTTALLNGEALVLVGGHPNAPEKFEPGECTD